MKLLHQMSYFARAIRHQVRYRKLSQCAFELLRVHLHGDTVECDWLAHPSDILASDIQPALGERVESEQLLHDVIEARDLIFRALPNVTTATINVFRLTDKQSHERIIAGTVTRKKALRNDVRSVAMQARLCGLQFHMNDGRLYPFE